MPKRVFERREVMSFSLDPRIADRLREYSKEVEIPMSVIVEKLLRKLFKALDN